ncbi:DNA-binding MarR family transcriptional regulator [Enterovirga rhinocerotis]|uniref:DNA-binding MarR family transcriptional regulator n=1 Tax=Enterovirga rhinocerotis TaxID=1339210 RepID=A0A4R7C7J4_9HYPH|nr:DNA-binding MarR family transcriptional regulator [Enterovirga rhinocerotis]
MTTSLDSAQDIAGRRPEARPLPPAYELIELLFFAYRDFVGDPDRVLSELGFGRAHHRVVHFVARRPGLPVADLLDLLQITKQSLNRVLKELVDKGFVEARVGAQDRRQRLLYPTEAGLDLSDRLVRIQTRRIRRALGRDEDGELEAAARLFLSRMIDRPERCGVREPGGSDNP